MSQNENSLLLKIKGDSAGAKAAVAETRAAMATLRTSAGSEMNSLRVSTTNAAQGTRQLVNGFQALSAGVTVLDGPLGGVASRLRAMGTVASEATQILSATGTQAAGTGVSIAAIAGPIGIAIAATAILAAGSVVLTKALFDLAVTAADFRGKMFDLSQQTGVAVETLSTLEIVAKTTGGSIDSIAQSLVIFQGKLDEAQDSGSKAGKIFTELGISTNNTEDAFRDALTQIAKMPVGFEQTNTAAELFGRRGGKQILAILKEMDGDLDGTTAKLREMGLVISEEDARAADEFNDQLAIMQFQFRAMLGKEVIPAALIALKDLSKFLKDNKQSISLVNGALGEFSTLIGGKVKTDLQSVSNALLIVNGTLKVTTDFFERIARATGLMSAPNFAGAIAGATSPFAGLDVGGTGAANLPGAKSGLFKVALEASKVQVEKELEVERNRREILALEFEKKNSDLENHYKRLQALTDGHLATLQKQITKEREAVHAGFERGEIDLAESEKRKADLNQRATEAQNKRDEETRRLNFEKQLALDQQEIDFRERTSLLAETRRKGELNRIEAALERTGSDERAAAEVAAVTKRLEFLKQAHDERIGIIKFEIAALSTSTERKKELDKELEISEQEYTDEVKRLTQLRIDIRAKEEFDRRNLDAQGATRQRLAGNRPRRVTEEDQLPPLPTSAIDQLFLAIDNRLTGDTHTAAMAGLTAMTEAFGQLGQAVGQAVYAFVLYGSAGKSVRQVTAEVLAGIAQMAATKAIFHLAEGFAALAMAFFGIPNAGLSAGAHFKAAAIYGVVAGVAAIAGRAVAGDSFSKQGSGSGGTTGGGGGGTTRSGPPPTREVDRTGQGFQAQPITRELVFKVKGDAVIDSFMEDFDLNGRTRIVIRNA